jgi:hypothetical protein
MKFEGKTTGELMSHYHFLVKQASRGKGQEGGRNSAVKKHKLNYRFHNPNSAAATADCILKILIEANNDLSES